MTQMVRIERTETPLSQAAKNSLAKEKQKSSGTYNTEEVNAALQDIFYNKCYLCEDQGLTSCQIEHLKPHKGDPELKFSWDNLFLVCTHCNNIKGDKYWPIWDCTQEDVDEHIAFRKEGYFGKPESLKFSPLDELPETQNTCALLNDVYYGTTPQKIIEANFIRKKLREEVGKFKNLVRDYMQAQGNQKKELYHTIKHELLSSSPFAAFKRWLIRDHADMYSDFMDCWKSNPQ